MTEFVELKELSLVIIKQKESLKLATKFDRLT